MVESGAQLRGGTQEIRHSFAYRLYLSCCVGCNSKRVGELRIDGVGLAVEAKRGRIEGLVRRFEKLWWVRCLRWGDLNRDWSETNSFLLSRLARV